MPRPSTPTSRTSGPRCSEPTSGDGRLVSIPSSHAKRLVVLDLVVQDFEPGEHYTERQVNAVLARWHDDVPAL